MPPGTPLHNERRHIPAMVLLNSRAVFRSAVFAIAYLSHVLEASVALNPSCRPPRAGICVDVWRCSYYATLLNQTPRPNYLLVKMKRNLCGFVNAKTPKVCCPFEYSQMLESAYEGVGNHRNFHLLPVDICGPISHGTRILEGVTTAPREFPWMALIAYKTGDSPEDQDFKCGGSLINARYVLTAAHCLDDKSVLGVRLGEYDILQEIDCDSQGQNCEPPVQDVMIDKIIIHEQYNPSTYINDIALVRLATPAILQENVRPICLPTGPLLKANLLGKFLTVTGWGTTETGHKSLVLNKVAIPVVPLKECRKIYGKFAPISKTQICAGGYKGRDSCSGDSGGPLQYVAQVGQTQRYIQDGIVSYGPKQCGISGRPAVYTNVKEYMSWILDRMEP